MMTELIAGVRGGEDGIATSLMCALAEVVSSGSKNRGEKAREAYVDVFVETFKDSQ